MQRFSLVAAAIVAAAPAIAQSSAREAVVAALTDSAAGWNAGDLDRFMALYSDRADTSYVAGKALLHGKAAIAESYRKAFDQGDAAKRGDLSFETLDVRMLGGGHALFIGRYRLAFAGGKSVTGMTTLVFAKGKAGWKVIADQSS